MLDTTSIPHGPQNARGAERAPKPVEVWGIDVRLQVGQRIRDLAIFDLALDSKRRACDLLQLKVGDLVASTGVKRLVTIIRQKSGRPVQFEVSERARTSISNWADTKRLPWIS